MKLCKNYLMEDSYLGVAMAVLFGLNMKWFHFSAAILEWSWWLMFLSCCVKSCCELSERASFCQCILLLIISKSFILHIFIAGLKYIYTG